MCVFTLKTVRVSLRKYCLLLAQKEVAENELTPSLLLCMVCEMLGFTQVQSYDTLLEKLRCYGDIFIT